MCGETVWPGEGSSVARLVTSAHGPEALDARELLVYPDARSAARVITRARAATAACERIQNQVWTALEEDTGYDSVTVGLSYTDGLGASLFQWTRVGSAVLLVHRYGEGTRRSLPDMGRSATELSRTLAPELCPFTLDGC